MERIERFGVSILSRIISKLELKDDCICEHLFDFSSQPKIPRFRIIHDILNNFFSAESWPKFALLSIRSR